MKVSVSQDALLESLKIVSRAVSGHNTLPVLGNILMRTEGERLFLSATNLEISISTSIKADVKEEGAITIPAKILTSYTSLLNKDEDVQFSVTEGSTLEIKSKSSKTKIKGIAAEEFPKIAEISEGSQITLPSRDFRSIVHEVAFASQENASRPILSGVLFNASKKQLKIAATDSYRLSEKNVELIDTVEDISCVIPVKTLFEADRLAPIGDNIYITISENQVMFSVDETQLISRLIEGQFPDYTQIIPKEHSTSIEVDREGLTLAMRRVSIFAKENNQHVKLEIGADDNLVIYTDSTQVGEERTTISVKVEGDANIIALNADYVLDVLNALNEEKVVRIELEGKMTPAVFKKEKNNDFIHLIMPLKM